MATGESSAVTATDSWIGITIKSACSKVQVVEGVVGLVEAEAQASEESEEVLVESGGRSSFVLQSALACLQSRRRVVLQEELRLSPRSGRRAAQGRTPVAERAEAEASRRLSRRRRGPRRGEATGQRSAEAEAPRSVLVSPCSCRSSSP